MFDPDLTAPDRPYFAVAAPPSSSPPPRIYTPTVGQACKEFGTRYRRPRGMYFTEEDRGHMAAMIYNWPHEDVRVIVVTDGSRILGLGDLGANGMGIPVGKLSLYCAAGGIAPHRVLPVVLDVGTDNEELLADPFYLGVNRRRMGGEDYYHLVDEFVQAVRYRWPNVLVQFEDFSSDKAQVRFLVALVGGRGKDRCLDGVGGISKVAWEPSLS